MMFPSFGSNRRFGLVLVAACVILFAIGWWHGTTHIGWLVAAIILLLITIAMPRILQPLRVLWMKLGGFLHVVVSPVLLAAFYFAAVVPVGALIQLIRKDLLRLKPGGKTYWVERRPPGPAPQTMPELF